MHFVLNKLTNDISNKYVVFYIVNHIFMFEYMSLSGTSPPLTYIMAILMAMPTYM